MIFEEYNELHLCFSKYSFFLYYVDDDDRGVTYAKLSSVDMDKDDVVFTTTVYANGSFKEVVEDILCESNHIVSFDKDTIVNCLKQFFDYYKILIEAGDSNE
ncbi:MAG: hypothetical protein ACRCSY_06140 [Cetobacterium sp.]